MTDEVPFVVAVTHEAARPPLEDWRWLASEELTPNLQLFSMRLYQSLMGQLFRELIEGATTDAGTRTAAARALATKLDASERTRLRVAAARCAEPPTRIALDMLAVAEDAEVDEAPAAAARVSARTARRRPDSA